jgi:K+-transporting ATPase ATPase C chain
MRTQILPAFLLFLALTLLTGIVYPFAVTGIAQALFPDAANGSLVTRKGRVVGSDLVGQAYSDPKWFWGRPSATTPPANASASSGSNLGPTNPALVEAVAERVKALREADPDNREPIPVDLVTASASGLDPHVSPAAARFQAGRVARARGLPLERVLALVERHVEGRTLGLLGEPRVNVLRLNLSLEDLR